ncbi:protein ALP1-like [Ipomoea triloba]|uniref:protein ALP1-like n=3 Tax=Ipomoea triloba TaxID=35885 RepID=UPI00125D7472|nr:protein ALP1-like [Ipomoea triloba]XP_031106418.1 protein ALP1-like [Ipomoea triloba]XP_031106419.1 protein ALP1-like [Ipomoea triloba]XP_031106420.1 protein ALP1-like [Ipomoea triloba]
MARLGITRIAERRKRIVAALTVFLEMYTAVSALVLLMASTTSLNSYRPSIKHYSLDSYYKREYVQRILNNNELCISLLRMNLQTFSKLCEMLESLGGLKPTRNMTIGEQVVIFLHILAHHVKNRVIQYNYGRSGESISRAFHKVLNAIMHLQGHLFRTPEPISANCTDSRWKWFKNCLGALDGTFIKVNVPSSDKPRYRTRKGDIATNVLGVCTPDMQFVYVLSGWEGSVADSRVLRDAISRTHALEVPHGCYYLVDAGYTNCEGFLAPFRGQRYHLNEWRHGYQPTSPQEFFNMKHAAARNVIERCFGLLKIRWGILRSPSYYPIKTHNRIIIACCLLHNLIRQVMQVDPMESELDAFDTVEGETNSINTVDPSDAWTNWRMELANQMFNQWNN